MIDTEFNTWILEINKSPSMDTNTVVYFIKKVTKNLVV